MANDVVVVLDCGATNVRAIAVDANGRIVAKSVLSNATQPAQENPTWHVWVLDEIMGKLGRCCREIREALNGADARVVGLTVTSFGVDGTLLDAEGNLLYPVISWKCPRTASVMADIRKYIDPDRLQRVSGVGHFTFNTIYKLIWLKENRPELVARATTWLFISSLINFRLTGVRSTDRTMAGTSQLLDLNSGTFSDEILACVGIEPTLFPSMVSPGTVLGTLQSEAAGLLGLSAGLPVTSSGHDTQFALFGSGAGMNQPVLSSGTWEILMVRSAHVDTAALTGFSGSTCELDATPGYFNPGLQWLASGVLEWLRETCWKDTDSATVYTRMMEEAEKVPRGCNGVRMIPELLIGELGSGAGALSGLSIATSRGHLYRAALEALAEKLAGQLRELEEIGRFEASELIIVGGGSKNHLWNQIKADAIQRPVRAVAENETTVLGAALYAFFGLGRFSSPDAARASVHHDYALFEPGSADLQPIPSHGD